MKEIIDHYEMKLLQKPQRLMDEKGKIHEVYNHSSEFCEILSEFGCSFPVSFNTSEGIKKMEPGKKYDENINEIY